MIVVLLRYICGVAVMLGSLALILYMILTSAKFVVSEAIEEERQKAQEQAQELAERKYKDYVDNTQYRVRFGMKIIDERGNK